MPRTRKPSRTYSKSQPRTKRTSKSLNLLPWEWKISPEHRLDLTGGILTFIGLLTFVGMLAATKGSVLDIAVQGLYKFAGYAAFLLPLTFLVIGLWLIIRRSPRIPQLSFTRFIGIVLLLLALFTLLFVISGAYGQAVSGYLGIFIGARLKQGFGVLGSLVILLAWLVIALSVTLDVSVPDLIRKLAPLFDKARKQWEKEKALDAKPSSARSTAREGLSLTELPGDFKPLDDATGKRPTGIRLLPPLESGPRPASTPRRPERKPATEMEMPPTIQPASPWVLPSIEAILDPAIEIKLKTGVDEQRARLIEETLKSFGAPSKIVEIQRGPVVTLFGVEPEYVESRQGRTRVRVGSIARLADDLSLALAARIRIQAPVPGKSYVGIEVPNAETSIVALREVMESESFRKIKSKLKFALGKDVSGKSIAADLTTMPHLLIAGTTGAGKSVCVNAILAGLLLINDPTDLKLLLIDPKRVELTGYNGIPHLLDRVVVEADKVLQALKWITREMEARYRKFNENGVRNIQEFNTRNPEKLPFIVVVIDELADLMMLAQLETEKALTRLAQLARATGIHLIISTQRPSVDVLTGIIKANFPSRIAFMVASNTDSRVILDQPGAERLLGRGDMLFQPPDAPAPVRLQGAFVSDAEIQRLVETWRTKALNANPEAKGTLTQVSMIPDGIPLKQSALFAEGDTGNDDPLLNEAIELIRREGRASISMLQRKMRIGYTRSARMIDRIEELGIIGPQQPNSQVREVLTWGQTAPPKEE